MTLAIPASAIVQVVPSVLSAGGTALDLSGLALTLNPRVPIGPPLSFPSTPAVAAYFGAAARETALAGVYFLGFDGSNKKPGALLLSRYAQTAAGAWLRGGPISGLSIAALQALTGSLTIQIDGAAQTDAALSLAGATSFSAAAALIATGLALTPVPGATLTGSIAATVLTVTAVASGSLAPGQTLAGGATAAGTTIVNQLTGPTGGDGTYTVSATQTVASGALTTTTPAVSFDSISGALVIASSTTGAGSSLAYATGSLATALGLTQATGAVLSQGAAAATPASAMNAITAVTQNWASFMTAFNPDGTTGQNTVKMAFAAWTNAQANRFAYVAWDTDITPTQSIAAPASMGALLAAGGYSGTIPVYDPIDTELAAFVMGAIASIDFTETAGRSTLAFKSQAGITATVTNQTVAANLIANGYNFYGAYATANDEFTFFYPGQISGPFDWIDSYIDQIWLNNQFQLALVVLLTQARAIPYNAAGDTLIKAAVMGVIIAGLNFGAFGPSDLSALQIAEVNAAAGLKIDTVLANVGWYFQSLAATTSPQVRAARGSPPATFWFCDNGSVQSLSLASVEVQ